MLCRNASNENVLVQIGNEMQKQRSLLSELELSVVQGELDRSRRGY